MYLFFFVSKEKLSNSVCRLKKKSFNFLYHWFLSTDIFFFFSSYNFVSVGTFLFFLDFLYVHSLFVDFFFSQSLQVSKIKAVTHRGESAMTDCRNKRLTLFCPQTHHTSPWWVVDLMQFFFMTLSIDPIYFFIFNYLMY